MRLCPQVELNADHPLAPAMTTRSLPPDRCERSEISLSGHTQRPVFLPRTNLNWTDQLQALPAPALCTSQDSHWRGGGYSQLSVHI